jgi:hypothetical protein
MPPPTPAWFSLLTAVGAGLVGALIAQWLTGRREHQRWVLDNKKLEYRELIDTLSADLGTMISDFSEDPGIETPGSGPNVPHLGETGRQALDSSNRVIDNRIFVADEIENSGLKAEWGRFYTTAKASSPYRLTMGELTKQSKFQAALLKVAMKDLQVPPVGKLVLIITMASGTLALTLSFLNDVVGASGAKSADPWLLPTSWVALGVSILGAVICMAIPVNNFDAPDLTTGKTKRWIKTFAVATKRYAIGLEWAALIAFAIGMFSLAAFGALNYRLFLDRKTGDGNDIAAYATKDANHFTIVPDPDHVGPEGKKHSHTFLLDQKSGSVWDVHCRPDGAVEFRRVLVDGVSDRNAP